MPGYRRLPHGLHSRPGLWGPSTVGRSGLGSPSLVTVDGEQTAAGAQEPSMSEIRAWRANGIPITDRGRLKARGPASLATARAPGSPPR